MSSWTTVQVSLKDFKMFHRLLSGWLSLCFLLSVAVIADDSAAHNAVLGNDRGALIRALDDGADVNFRGAQGSTLLMLAAGRGLDDIASLLVERGADVFVLDSQMGVTPLHRAAQSGSVAILELLLSKGAYIDDQSGVNGHTPLIDAAFYKRYEAFEYLLRRDANTELRNTLGLNVSDWASRQKDSRLLDLIEQQGERDEKRLAEQKLLQAVRDADLAKAIQILDENPSYDVNEVGKDGMTPLLVASRAGLTDIVRQLLAHGADPNIVDKMMKATPAHKAGFFGHAKILQELCKAGANIDAQGPYNGYTALHDAVLNSHIEAAQVLIDFGASTNIEGLDGKSPRSLAFQLGIADKLRWSRP